MRTVNRSGKNGRAAEKLLASHLDDRFTLVHHPRLRGLREPVDAVLIGPHGALVLAIADDRERVRCLGDNWYVGGQKSEHLIPTLHNPVKKAQGDRAAMEAHVAARQMGSTMPVDGVVLVPDLRAQVEFMQPVMPVLDADGITQFAEQLAQQRELIEWQQADDLLKSFGVTPLGQSWRQMDRPAMRAARPRRLWGLTRQQLVVLAVIAAADFAVLLAGALILLLR